MEFVLQLRSIGRHARTERTRSLARQSSRGNSTNATARQYVLSHMHAYISIHIYAYCMPERTCMYGHTCIHNIRKSMRSKINLLNLTHAQVTARRSACTINMHSRAYIIAVPAKTKTPSAGARGGSVRRWLASPGASNYRPGGKYSKTLFRIQ